MDLMSEIGLAGAPRIPAATPSPLGSTTARPTGAHNPSTFGDHLDQALGSRPGATSGVLSPPPKEAERAATPQAVSSNAPSQGSAAGIKAWLDLVRIWAAARMAALPDAGGSSDPSSPLSQGDSFGADLLPFVIQALSASGSSTGAAPVLPMLFGATSETAALAPVANGSPAPPGTGRWDALIQNVAARRGLDPALLRAVMMAESGGNPAARSPAGALGLMQLMPSTARALGVDPLDPAQNLDGGAQYLRSLLDRYGGDVLKATAAYNAGPGAVDRYGGIPPYQETQAYVRRIQQLYARYV
ncbi:Lytic transglycosylase catalytic [Kyrpidia tusciae DSM 2912]|uniref:Lytic transglycosylase catalytic n=2 Tax=Kyrpidia TaxID=1129704 RepID=D5WUG5_KYRT2|nr:Lytic transglycosylase catalytic [Kyrpidia tusciae DSM 2912]